MRGIILAGGKGSRLRPFTYSGAKQLVPIANTPVLHFPVRQLVAAGITDIALVVGDSAAQVREAMGDGSSFGARFTYIPQEAPLGIAHAVGLCQEFVSDERFVVYLGDNVLRRGIEAFAAEFRDGAAEAAVILKEVADPRAFGVARMDGERLAEVVEKPMDPPSSLAVTGVYGFSPVVFPVIAAQSPSGRGELEIAHSINGLIAAGHTVTASVTTDDWIDTGKMDDILAANRIALADVECQRDRTATIVDSQIADDVSIAPGVHIDRCTIRGPVAVDANTRLTRCTIGPNVSIGANCLLEDVTIQDAIVMDRAELRNCPGIIDSMIGRDTCVIGAGPGTCLTLGDHSRIEGAS
jgi:glucose-1-phosphate thymidylyltransferase